MSAAHASPSAQSPILKLPLTHSKCGPDQVAQDAGSGLSLGPGLCCVSQLLALPSLPPSVPSLPALQNWELLFTVALSKSLSGSLSVCFASKAPRGSIGLAGQTMGSGPCSRARLLTAALGQGSTSGLPSCGQSHGCMEVRAPSRGAAGRNSPVCVRVCSQNPSPPGLPSDARPWAPSGSATGRQEQRLTNLSTAPRVLCTRASEGPRWQPHSSRQAVSLVL